MKHFHLKKLLKFSEPSDLYDAKNQAVLMADLRHTNRVTPFRLTIWHSGGGVENVPHSPVRAGPLEDDLLERTTGVASSLSTQEDVEEVTASFLRRPSPEPWHHGP